ncbi:Uncharacterized protein FWK35_00009137, partial [Aphis craccivora]
MLKIIDFISYWYMRYLLVSELYLVERWERCMIHTIMFILFFGLWYMNKVFIEFVSNYFSAKFKL